MLFAGLVAIWPPVATCDSSSRGRAGEGHADVAAQLHAAGARLTAGGAEFLVAAERGYTGIVRTLVAAGTDVNMQRGAALLAAVLGGHEATVAALLALGADPDVRNGAPLRYARERGHATIEALLLAKVARR